MKEIINKLAYIVGKLADNQERVVKTQKETVNKITHVPKTDKWTLVTPKDHDKYCDMK